MDKLILPTVDLRACTAVFLPGAGHGSELIDWLNTIPLWRSKNTQIWNMQETYEIFVQDAGGGDHEACVFEHCIQNYAVVNGDDGTGRLSGLCGKANMDRNSPEYLCDKCRTGSD